MGIDTHSLNFLRHATAGYGKLGSTITLGRLNVLLGPRASRSWVGTSNGAYCETLLIEKFGATNVDSIDNSSYEGATIIADMNLPLPDTLAAKYDTVLDFGCSGHIFDVAQSLRNIAMLCKRGGTILHAVPANGFCGHGFYQFSPELFFSWYSDTNGFVGTEVYLAELTNSRYWYRVSKPQNGERINVRSRDEMYVLVATKRMEDHHAPTSQQSDYAYTWEHCGAEPAKPHPPGRFAIWRELLSKLPTTARIASRLDAAISPRGAKLPNKHPALTRVPVG